MTIWWVRLTRYRRVRFVIALALFVFFLYVGLMWFEESMIFYPMVYPQGDWDVDYLPAREGEIKPRIEDVALTASDGVRLHGWFCTPQTIAGRVVRNVAADPVLLFFHGNAGNITHRLPILEVLVQIPACVFILDYRGYGKSEGRPSETGLYRDARAAWRYLVEERGIPAEHVVLFGNSLGGAVAIELAQDVRAAGLIAQSSFTSIPDMAALTFPFVPRFLVRTQFASLDKVGRLTLPKLFVHGNADELVPLAMGRRLYDAAAPPKAFYEVPGADHNDLVYIGGAPYLERIRAFVAECVARR